MSLGFSVSAMLLPTYVLYCNELLFFEGLEPWVLSCAQDTLSFTGRAMFVSGHLVCICATNEFSCWDPWCTLLPQTLFLITAGI